MSNPIELTLSPSRTAGWLAGLPSLGLSVVLLGVGSCITPWAFALLPASLLLSWQDFRRCGQLRGANAIVSIRTSDKHLHCKLADGSELLARVSGCSILGAALLALKVQSVDTRSRTTTTILFSFPRLYQGNVPEQAFRRLRVWLVAGPAAISR
ncbi:hypothetical protein [Marinobacter sp. VGCF2001]|uniref:hypothetical protein n=1 Tax=Marinobacter sp. VGCF2001 TaxID=3417189 RepID=UPI003CF2BF22